MPTRAIIFDLWNTLAYNKGVRKNPIVMLEEMLGLNMNLYREVESGFMTRKFGTRREAIVNLCKHIGVKPDYRLVDRIVMMWEGLQLNITLFPDVVHAMRHLRKKYKVGLISNTECFSAQEFREKGYDKHFDYVGFSCETGHLKPSPDVFALAMRALGAKANETVMVGDNLKDDVLAAERLGMKAVLIKRDFGQYDAKPSWVETGVHSRIISSLKELDRFL